MNEENCLHASHGTFRMYAMNYLMRKQLAQQVYQLLVRQDSSVLSAVSSASVLAAMPREFLMKLQRQLMAYTKKIKNSPEFWRTRKVADGDDGVNSTKILVKAPSELEY